MTPDGEQDDGMVSKETVPRSRSLALLVVFLLFLTLAFIGFVSLGTWQLHRLSWKQALIERVEQRVHATAVPIPHSDRWARINANADEYRRVQTTGVFLHDLGTKVQASTGLGAGYWLLTPLRTPEGTIVFVNRGFIPPEMPPHRIARPSGEVTVKGLLRMSEPEGGFLRKNNPASGRWYSRDIHAIAATHGLTNVAPYFIDEESRQERLDGKSGTDALIYPIGGLTVISFHNNHLVYALTWYALALMAVAAGGWIIRDKRK